jgi:hypothetical protein
MPEGRRELAVPGMLRRDGDGVMGGDPTAAA